METDPLKGNPIHEVETPSPTIGHMSDTMENTSSLDNYLQQFSFKRKVTKVDLNEQGHVVEA